MAMLAQMIRVCGTTYWLVGQAEHRPVRCKVVDSTTWRQRYRLTALDVTERRRRSRAKAIRLAEKLSY